MAENQPQSVEKDAGCLCDVPSARDNPDCPVHYPAASPEWLPEFPLDDDMLNRIDHAVGTCWTYNDDGERVHHGGDYTLPELLDFMSGYDASLAIPLGTAPGMFGDDVEWTEYPFPTYHENDVIRALVAEVRRLRTCILPPRSGRDA